MSEMPSSLSRHRCECSLCTERGAEIVQLRAQIADLTKASQILHKLVSNRDAEIDTLKIALTAPTADEIKLREQLVTARQHAGWLKQYCAGMTDQNWADMRIRIERQLYELSTLLTDDQGASK